MTDITYQEMMVGECPEGELDRFFQERGFEKRNKPGLDNVVWERPMDLMFVDVSDSFSCVWYNGQFEDSLKVDPTRRVTACIYDSYNVKDIRVSQNEMVRRQGKLKDLMYDLQEHLSTEGNVVTHLYEVSETRSGMRERVSNITVRTL